MVHGFLDISEFNVTVSSPSWSIMPFCDETWSFDGNIVVDGADLDDFNIRFIPLTPINSGNEADIKFD